MVGTPGGTWLWVCSGSGEVTGGELLLLLLQVMADMSDAGVILGIVCRDLDVAAVPGEDEVVRGLVLVEAHGFGAVLLHVGGMVVVGHVVLGEAQAHEEQDGSRNSHRSIAPEGAHLSGKLSHRFAVGYLQAPRQRPGR